MAKLYLPLGTLYALGIFLLATGQSSAGLRTAPAIELEIENPATMGDDDEEDQTDDDRDRPFDENEYLA